MPILCLMTGFSSLYVFYHVTSVGLWSEHTTCIFQALECIWDRLKTSHKLLTCLIGSQLIFLIDSQRINKPIANHITNETSLDYSICWKCRMLSGMAEIASLPFDETKLKCWWLTGEKLCTSEHKANP